MARELCGRARRVGTSRWSLTALVLFSSVLWACQNVDTPTAARSIRASAASHSAAPQSEVIPGQYIITFADTVSDVPGLAKRMAAQYGREPLFTYTAAIRGFAAQLPDQAIEALQHNPQIERIEQDQVVQVSDVQTGPVWNLDRIDQRNRPLDASYTYAYDGSGVNVYIIDTGIRTTHSEFGGRAFGGYTAISDGNGTNDCDGHGTHVAGTVGGVRFGVAKGVKLYAVRVLDCTGSGTWGQAIAGIDWVTQHRILPAVANMSLGGAYSSTVNTAVQNSIKAGVVYAVAAGNNAGDACNYSPSSTPEALTVGSTWQLDGMSGFSNYGPCLDLFAPGESIRSAAIIDDTSSVLKGGTSMASPHVAGVAALYLSANPTATPSQVAAAIVANATPNVLTSVPAGTINLLVYSALSNSTPALPPSDTTTTQPSPTSPTPTSPTPVDQPPTASFTSSCPHGKCAFDASASTDDHGITTYAWNFGDGSTTSTGGSQSKTAHTYTRAGTYTVTLTVTDSAGQKGVMSLTLVFKKL